MDNKYIVTWHDFHLFSRKLAYFLKDKSFKAIVSINIYGLILAALLARELKIDFIYKLTEDVLLKEGSIIDKLKNSSGEIIFVTDIVNNDNDLFKKLKLIFNNGYFVSIFVKPNTKILVDKYILEIPTDICVVEPWETIYSYIPPIKDIL